MVRPELVRIRRTVLIGLLAAALALGGCGSGSSGFDDECFEAAPETTPTPGQVESPRCEPEG